MIYYYQKNHYQTYASKLFIFIFKIVKFKIPFFFSEKDPKIITNELIEKINENGIGTSVHYIPIHMHSYYAKKYGFKQEDFPVAKELSETVITLSLFPKMKDEEVEYIISTLMNLWHQFKF